MRNWQLLYEGAGGSTRSMIGFALFAAIFCLNAEICISNSCSSCSRSCSIILSRVSLSTCRRLSVSPLDVSAFAILMDSADISLLGNGVSKSPNTILGALLNMPTVHSRSKSSSLPLSSWRSSGWTRVSFDAALADDSVCALATSVSVEDAVALIWSDWDAVALIEFIDDAVALMTFLKDAVASNLLLLP